MLELNDFEMIDDIKYTVLYKCFKGENLLKHDAYIRATLQEFQTYDTARDYVLRLDSRRKPIICFARDAGYLAEHLSKELLEKI